jgi:NAD-dependent SIR2 family protein deacetylase
MKPSEAPFAAFKNRESLKDSCGCFKCLETFDVSEITEWTDGEKTAICPKCNNDSVLEETDSLQKIHDFWFEEK